MTFELVNLRGAVRTLLIMLIASMISVQVFAAPPTDPCRALLNKGDAFFTLPPVDGFDSASHAAWSDSVSAWTAAYRVCQVPSVPVELRARSAKRWADLLRHRGHQKEAEIVLTNAIDDVERSESPNSILLVDLLQDLETMPRLIDRAEDLLQTEFRIMNIRTKAFGKTSTEVAKSLETIGFVYERLGDMALAESYYRQAIETAKNACGNPCYTLAGTYGALYDFLKEQPGREAEAHKIEELSEAAVPVD